MPVLLFQASANDEEGIHIEQDMQHASVKQKGCDQSPQFSSLDEFIDLCPKKSKRIQSLDGSEETLRQEL